MNNNAFISIADFAKVHNVPKAKVYEMARIPENAPFVIKENGIIKVSQEMPIGAEKNSCASAEAAHGGVEDAHGANTGSEGTHAAHAFSPEMEAFYKEEIERLRAELQLKDNIIQQNTSLITSLLEKQQELTEKALILANQAQILQASAGHKKGFFRRLLEGKHDG